jgi:phosphoribosyl 1,2-cyclic phosphodiesterase
MKNAIIVSRDAHWRTVMEGTLLARGWQVASVEGFSEGDQPDAEHVHAILVDAASVDSNEVANWMKSGGDHLKVPLVMVPVLSELDALADTLDVPSAASKPSSGVILRFWGVRGSIPTPGPDTAFYGGNTSCVELNVDNHSIILDAGSGIRMLGMDLMARAARAKEPLDMHLLISHTHWDHIQGLPFFVPAFIPNNRLHILGYSAVRHHLADVLAMQMEPTYFPISMDDMPAHPDVHEVDDHFELGEVKVVAFFTNHPGRCAGFRFETRAGSVAYVSDNEINSEGQATHLPRETAQHLHDRMVDTLHGVRILIHDAQYSRAEYKTKVGWGHSAFEDVVEMAGEAGVEHLILFHHDPMRSDDGINKIVKEARALAAQKGFQMRIDAAREGMEIHL